MQADTLQDADIGCYRKFFPDELPQNVERQIKIENFSFPEIRARNKNGSAVELFHWKMGALGPDTVLQNQD
jgi:hypothetical protein